MLEFFNSNPIPSIIAGTIVALFTIFLIMKTKGAGLNLGPLSIFTKKEDKKEEKENEPELIGQKKLKTVYFNILIEHVREITEKYSLQLHELKNEIIFSQMKFSEEKMIEVRRLLCNKYAELLLLTMSKEQESKESLNVKLTPDYVNFKMLVNSMLYFKIKDILKTSFIENHLVSYNDFEYESYIKRKIDIIIVSMTEYLDKNYTDNFYFVSRESLNKATNDLLSNISIIFHQIFANARSVAVISVDRSAIIKSEMNTEISEQMLKLKEDF